jgi:hypothetical protein
MMILKNKAQLITKQALKVKQDYNMYQAETDKTRELGVIFIALTNIKRRRRERSI